MSSILLVEDNLSISTPFQSLLEGDGHDVTVCRDASSAVTVAEGSTAMDIAFVDYWLAQGTSEPVLTALRAKRPDVHVILITGGSEEVSVETTRWLGALDGIDGFLQKPFSHREVRAIIDKVSPQGCDNT
ncbi:MAG: response regulator [Paracoccus sp. (in: a-proteobacteria)]